MHGCALWTFQVHFWCYICLAHVLCGGHWDKMVAAIHSEPVGDKEPTPKKFQQGRAASSGDHTLPTSRLLFWVPELCSLNECWSQSIYGPSGQLLILVRRY